MSAQHTPDYRRFVNVQAGGLKARLETTNCYWCRGDGWVCGSCYQTSVRMRESLARTGAKRDAHAVIAKATGEQS